MRYMTIGLMLLIAACAKEPEKRVAIPERAPQSEAKAGAIPWVPCPPNVPRICCKDRRACQ